MKIKVILPAGVNPEKSFRELGDLLPYQDVGVELYFGYNVRGPIHCQSSIEEGLAIATMPQAAAMAEQEGMDAIVIESMGDTGLIQCREAVRIPVVGMSDVSLRVAQMLGRKFGIVTAGYWHGYAIERLIRSYNLSAQYVGFQELNVQPFFTDVTSEEQLEDKIVASMFKLLERDADTIVLGGSYFLGKSERLTKALAEKGYPERLIIDPLPLAIRFARMLVDSRLTQSKLIYATPEHVMSELKLIS